MTLVGYHAGKAMFFFLIGAFFLIGSGVFAERARGDLNEIVSGFEDQENSKAFEIGPDEAIDGFDESTEDKADQPNNTLDTFDRESGEIVAKDARNSQSPDLPDLTGSIGLSSAYNLRSHRAPPFTIDLDGFSRLRTRAELQADFSLPSSWRARISGHIFHDWVYGILDRNNFTHDLLDENETEVELGETYILGRLGPDIDLKFGRQIVVWGTSESLRVTDVVNPMDRREPGVVDIEDLRLPVAMTRIDYYFNNQWGITGLAIHELRPDKEPPFGSDFFPGALPQPKRDMPDFSFKNQEWAMALTGRLTGWDLSLHGAWMFDDSSYLDSVNQGIVRRSHARVAMVGGTVQVARGNWLIKAEGALLKGLKHSNLPDHKKSRIDLLAGLEYNGFRDMTITFEAVNRHILDYDDRLQGLPDDLDENEFQGILRIVKSFYHETLHLTLLASAFGIAGKGGAFERAQIEYDWTDDLSVILGAVFYQGGDKSFLESIEDNDRLFAELKYSF
ncbi:MAG: DUF1302 family protein [Thermodesulfobacteriota bacterium]|nr:DUF1302 family protein [Thermodesulfobacteriota bacterium]